MKTNKIDIKSLTSEIKNLTRNKPVTNTDRQESSDKELVQQTGLHVESQAEPNNTNDAHVSQFLDFIKEVNSKDHYQIDRYIYVDADIHEVFNKLKTHTRLKLSHLVSHLLESFIIQHQESIKEIISKKQNKFLDL